MKKFLAAIILVLVCGGGIFYYISNNSKTDEEGNVACGFSGGFTTYGDGKNGDEIEFESFETKPCPGQTLYKAVKPYKDGYVIDYSVTLENGVHIGGNFILHNQENIKDGKFTGEKAELDNFNNYVTIDQKFPTKAELNLKYFDVDELVEQAKSATGTEGEKVAEKIPDISTWKYKDKREK